MALVAYRLAASNPHGGWDAWAIWNLRAKFLAGFFAGYCAAVLANPTLLRNRVVSPFDRMFSQLWPSFVFLIFLPLRSMEERAPHAPAPKPLAEKRKRKKRS